MTDWERWKRRTADANLMRHGITMEGLYYHVLGLAQANRQKAAVLERKNRALRAEVAHLQRVLRERNAALRATP